MLSAMCFSSCASSGLHRCCGRLASSGWETLPGPGTLCRGQLSAPVHLLARRWVQTVALETVQKSLPEMTSQEVEARERDRRGLCAMRRKVLRVAGRWLWAELRLCSGCICTPKRPGAFGAAPLEQVLAGHLCLPEQPLSPPRAAFDRVSLFPALPSQRTPRPPPLLPPRETGVTEAPLRPTPHLLAASVSSRSDRRRMPLVPVLMRSGEVGRISPCFGGVFLMPWGGKLSPTQIGRPEDREACTGTTLVAVGEFRGQQVFPTGLSALLSQCQVGGLALPLPVSAVGGGGSRRVQSLRRFLRRPSGGGLAGGRWAGDLFRWACFLMSSLAFLAAVKKPAPAPPKPANLPPAQPGNQSAALAPQPPSVSPKPPARSPSPPSQQPNPGGAQPPTSAQVSAPRRYSSSLSPIQAPSHPPPQPPTQAATPPPQPKASSPGASPSAAPASEPGPEQPSPTPPHTPTPPDTPPLEQHSAASPGAPPPAQEAPPAPSPPQTGTLPRPRPVPKPRNRPTVPPPPHPPAPSPAGEAPVPTAPTTASRTVTGE